MQVLASGECRNPAPPNYHIALVSKRSGESLIDVPFNVEVLYPSKEMALKALVDGFEVTSKDPRILDAIGRFMEAAQVEIVRPELQG